MTDEPTASEKLRLWHSMPYPKNLGEHQQAARRLDIHKKGFALDLLDYWEPCAKCGRPKHRCRAWLDGQWSKHCTAQDKQ